MIWTMLIKWLWFCGLVRSRYSRFWCLTDHRFKFQWFKVFRLL